MIVKFFPLDEVFDCSFGTAASVLNNLWKWIPDALIIPGNMRLDMRPNGRHGIFLSAALRKKHFNTCSSRLCCLDKDKFVFVGNYHEAVFGILTPDGYDQRAVGVESSAETSIPPLRRIALIEFAQRDGRSIEPRHRSADSISGSSSRSAMSLRRASISASVSARSGSRVGPQSNPINRMIAFKAGCDPCRRMRRIN